jgi:hypothetical protein
VLESKGNKWGLRGVFIGRKFAKEMGKGGACGRPFKGLETKPWSLVG